MSHYVIEKHRPPTQPAKKQILEATKNNELEFDDNSGNDQI